MINEIKKLFDQYIKWLKDETQIKELDGAVEITTPFLDRHNDYLQIYAIKRDNGIILTDDSYIIRDLKMSGCDLDTPKRKEILKLALNGFGVQMDKNNDSLFVKVSSDNFSVKKHDLLQAMLAINDLFYLAAPTVVSLFFEDVANWLNTSNIRYNPRIKIPGKTGYDHCFDFLIPASPNKAPERIIQAINKPTKENAEGNAFALIDIRESRSPDLKAYAFLNDKEEKIPDVVMEILNNYEFTPVSWKEREKVKEALIA